MGEISIFVANLLRSLEKVIYNDWMPAFNTTHFTPSQ